jgi:hypothetical protein
VKEEIESGPNMGTFFLYGAIGRIRAERPGKVKSKFRKTSQIQKRKEPVK